MPVDASPYRNQQPAPNLLEQVMQVGKAADVMGDIEVGRGMQQAIQPDGSVDRNILAQHLKGSVAGAMKATPAMTALEHLRNAGYATDEQGLRTMAEKTRYVTSALAPLGTKDRVTQQELVQVAGRMLKEAEKYGIKVPEIMSSLERTQGMTDQQRAQTVKGQIFQGQQAGRVFDALLEQTRVMSTGQRDILVGTGSQVAPRVGLEVQRELAPETDIINPATKEPQKLGIQPRLPGGGVTYPPKPGEEAAALSKSARPAAPRQIEVDARGKPMVPRAAAPAAPVVPPAVSGAAAVAPAGPTGAPAAAAPAAAASFADRFGAAYGKPTGPATGQAPGEVRAQEASAEAYAKDLADARNYQERVQPLREAIPRLARLGKTGTGPGTETYNQLKSMAQTWGIPIPDPDALKDFAEAKKYLMQNATAIAPPGTNIPSVTAAFEANPNVEQPNAAALYLAKSMLTLSRLKNASVRAFQETGLPPRLYTDWAADWVSRQDPKAYGADLWSKADRDKLSKKLKPGSTQAKRFRSSVDEARRLGLFGDVEYVEPK